MDGLDRTLIKLELELVGCACVPVLVLILALTLALPACPAAVTTRLEGIRTAWLVWTVPDPTWTLDCTRIGRWGWKTTCSGHDAYGWCADGGGLGLGMLLKTSWELLGSG